MQHLLSGKTVKKGGRGALGVYNALREDILWARIAPGTPLDEVSLATRFSVSRTPIREALFLLAGEKLVTFLENRTTVVAPFDLGNLGDHLEVYVLLCRLAVSLAARSGLDLAPLRGLAHTHRTAAKTGDHAAFLSSRKSMIGYIADATDNIFLSRYIEDVLDAGHRAMVLVYFAHVTHAELRKASDRFSELLDCLEAHDARESDRLISTLIADEMVVLSRKLKPKVAFDLDLSPGDDGLAFEND